MAVTSGMFDLGGKVAIVTGSSRGIGRDIALTLAGLGARVVVTSRKIEPCETVAAEIRAAGGEAMPVACNISSREQCEALVATTIAAWGKVDILVCNAAVSLFIGPTIDMPEWAFDKTMATNVKSNVWLCDLVCPGMAQRRDGVVVVIGSAGGLRGSDQTPVYGMSKAADMQLVRNVAVQWGPQNVRANCVAPSLIETEMAEVLTGDPKRQEMMKITFPLGRVGRPEDVSGIVAALCSRAGAWMTGQTIVIDGGMMASGGRFS